MAKKTAQPKQVVHYAAHGTRGLAFPCYFREMDVYRASERQGPLTAMERYGMWPRTLPAPRTHTDLRRVTCPECWDSIGALARSVARDGLG